MLLDISQNLITLSSFDKFHFSSFFWDLMTPRNCLSLTVFTLHPLEFSKLWFNIFFCLSFHQLASVCFLILAFFHLSVRNSSNLILETTMFLSKIPLKYHLLGTQLNFTNFQFCNFRLRTLNCFSWPLISGL